MDGYKLEIIASKEKSRGKNLSKIINAGLAGLSAGTITGYKMLENLGEEYDDAMNNLKPKKIIADLKNRYHLIYEYFKKGL